jgi:hypothetical protein
MRRFLAECGPLQASDRLTLSGIRIAPLSAMNTTDPSNYQRPDAYRMPPPEIPKQKINRFTWMFMAFAALVLLGIIASFVRVADEPRPVLDVPADQPAPAAPAPAPAPLAP